MPVSPADYRAAQGRYDQRSSGMAAASREARLGERFPPTGVSLNLTGVANTCVGALLALSLVRGGEASARTPATGRGAGYRSPGECSGPAPFSPLFQLPAPHGRSMASSAHGSTPATGNLANTALLICAVRPSACLAAAGTAAIVAGAGLIRTGLHVMAADGKVESTPAMVPSAVSTAAREDALSAAVVLIQVDDVPLEAVLLALARDCGADRACRADRIRSLLQRLPPASQKQLQDSADPVAPPVTSALLPGAGAATVPELSVLMDQLVQTLADMYTPDVAAYQSDLEQIVGPLGRREGSVSANARRLDTVEALLQRDGFTVQRLPYDTAGLDTRGQALPAQAHNLHAQIRAGSGPRLLLVAHADKIGRGSEGAYDNGSGVAALLHVARQVAAVPGTGTASVSLLITSNEELGLLGSRAYVEACHHSGSCPDMVINVDMVGRGGHGYVLSDTASVAAYDNPGQPPYHLGTPVVSTVECEAGRVIQQAFDEHGFTRHLAEMPYMITSDNLSFQNRSIPCIGLTQVDERGADALRVIDQARAAWVNASRALDWDRMDRIRNGEVEATPEERAMIGARFGALVQAEARYRQSYTEARHAPIARIHSGWDDLARVNPQMAVAFADVLVHAIRPWGEAGAVAQREARVPSVGQVG